MLLTFKIVNLLAKSGFFENRKRIAIWDMQNSRTIGMYREQRGGPIFDRGKSQIRRAVLSKSPLRKLGDPHTTSDWLS